MEQSQLRAESNRARDEGREHVHKGTEAAKESAKEYKGAVQQEGQALMKGAEDRYESAKNYTKQKSGEIADSAVATKDASVDKTVGAKDTVVDNTVRAKDSIVVNPLPSLQLGIIGFLKLSFWRIDQFPT